MCYVLLPSGKNGLLWIYEHVQCWRNWMTNDHNIEQHQSHFPFSCFIPLVAFILKHIITCRRQPVASVGRHATKICWSVMRRAQISSCALSYCVALLLLFSNLLVRNYVRWSVLVLKQTPWYNNIVFSLEIKFFSIIARSYNQVINNGMFWSKACLTKCWFVMVFKQ